jgi:hypothetical protein
MTGARPHERMRPGVIPPRTRGSGTAVLLGILALVLTIHAMRYRESEPFYNNDETRHVMTGVFVADWWRDAAPARNLEEYGTRYYLQYPALGIPWYPPLFYAIEGTAMRVLGTSVAVGKGLILCFLALACAYLYRFVRHTHDEAHAAAATLVFALSPNVVTLSSYVMLEIPTLAWGLVSTFHFWRYLEDERRRDLVVAALAFTCAVLTRFSGVYLLPLFAILAAVRNRRAFARLEVILVAAAVLVLVAPYYVFAGTRIGWVHLHQVSHGTSIGATGRGFLDRMLDYLIRLPAQIGWPSIVAAGAGLLAAIRGRAAGTTMAPYIGILAASYLVFSPMAIHDPRFIIYWCPGFAALAAIGTLWTANRLGGRPVRIAAILLLVGGTAWVGLRAPTRHLHGYEEAARYVVENTRSSRFCMFDGAWNGNFIFQTRRADPDRRLWVLRGDRILYSVMIQPSLGYEGKADDATMLETIYRYDPEYIVLESPDRMRTEASGRLRALVRGRPDRFQLERSIALDTNEPELQGVALEIYRNLVRNPNPEKNLNVPMLALKRTLGTIVP